MRSRRSTISAAVLLAAAVASTGFTDSTTATGTSQVAPDSRWRVEAPALSVTADAAGAERERPHPSARSALETVEDLGARNGPGEAARAHLVALDSDEVGTERDRQTVAASATATPAATYAWGFGDAVADLDGDGKDDVLIAGYDLELEALVLTAHRGVDGSEMWSLTDADIEDLFASVVPDVTGDGAADLLVWDLVYGNADCEDEDCNSWLEEFTWTVRIREGRSGALTWSQTFPGYYRETWDYQVDESTWGDTYEERSEIEAQNYWVVPDIGGDHDGDGVSDIILNRFDVVSDTSREYASYEDPLPIRQDGASRDIELRSTVSLISGHDGGTFWERTAEGPDGDASARSFGDATGSATADLLWLQFGYPEGSTTCRSIDVLVIEQELECEGAFVDEWTTTATLLDGDTRESVWSVQTTDDIDQYTSFYRANGDLDGDGGVDLFEFVDTWDDETGDTSSRITARSGAAGTALWTADTNWGTALVAGSIDGGTNDDVLIIDKQAFEEGDEFGTHIDLRRVDGASGSELLRTSHDFLSTDGSWTYAYAYAPADVDGDGVIDIGISVSSYDDDYRAISGIELLESTVSGDELFRLDGDGDTYIYDVPDLDADGDGEIVLVRILSMTVVQPDGWAYEEPYGVDVEARQHGTGEVLWRLPRFDYWEDWLDVGGDLDGAPGADLVESRNATAPTSVSVRNGATGAVVWTR